MCVVGPGVGKGEGASEQIPESVRGLGLGSWGTVAGDDVGELTVEITLCSQSTSSVVGGVVVATPKPHPSLLSSSSGVMSERKSCMRRSVVAGSLS